MVAKVEDGIGLAVEIRCPICGSYVLLDKNGNVIVREEGIKGYIVAFN